MEGILGEDLTDHESLVAGLHDELVNLRGQLGALSIQKFSQYPVLRRICGGNDLLDAFLMFEREMSRYQKLGRNEAAAAISICAPAETVLDRLEHAVGALPQDGKLRDQRTARRWSDAGLKIIAAELVYMADVQGRLGTETLSIEVRGGLDHGLDLVIDQMTSIGLPERAPLIRLWHYNEVDEPEERTLTIELDGLESAVRGNQDHLMKRYRLAVEFPSIRETADGSQVLSISVEGRDAPMRTVFFDDYSQLPPELSIQFSVYRTIAMINVNTVSGS